MFQVIVDQSSFRWRRGRCFSKLYFVEYERGHDEHEYLFTDDECNCKCLSKFHLQLERKTKLHFGHLIGVAVFKWKLDCIWQMRSKRISCVFVKLTFRRNTDPGFSINRYDLLSDLVLRLRFLSVFRFLIRLSKTEKKGSWWMHVKMEKSVRLYYTMTSIVRTKKNLHFFHYSPKIFQPLISTFSQCKSAFG